MRKIYPVMAVFLFMSLVFYFFGKPEQQSIARSDVGLCNFDVKPCSYIVEGKEVLLSSQHGIVKTEDETLFTLQSDQIKDLVIISAKMEGKDMYMGIVPLFFTKTNGIYQAETMLGACMHDKMVWRMVLEVSIEGKPKILTYEFYSHRE